MVEEIGSGVGASPHIWCNLSRGGVRTQTKQVRQDTCAGAPASCLTTKPMRFWFVVAPERWGKAAAKENLLGSTGEAEDAARSRERIVPRLGKRRGKVGGWDFLSRPGPNDRQLGFQLAGLHGGSEPVQLVAPRGTYHEILIHVWGGSRQARALPPPPQSCAYLAGIAVRRHPVKEHDSCVPRHPSVPS